MLEKLIIWSSALSTASRNRNRIVYYRRCRLIQLNMVYRDEDSILDQIYEKQIFSAFYYEDLKFD